MHNQRRTRCFHAIMFGLLLCSAPALAHDDEPVPGSQCNNAGPFGWPGLDLPPDQIGEWSPVQTWPIQGTHAAVLSSGKVLVFRRARPPYLWNPADGSLTATDMPASGDDLFCAGHTTLADGRLMVIGGEVNNNAKFGSVRADMFSPVTETWTRVADMHEGRWYPTATTLPDGRVLAMSGDITNEVRSEIPEIYDPVTNTWTQLPSAQLRTENYPCNFVMPDGRLFYGACKREFSRALDLDTFQWEVIATTNQPGGAGSSKTGAMYEPGKVVKMGGDVGVLEGVEVIDLNDAQPAWRETAPMNFPRRRADIVLLPDGNSLVVGGSVAGDASHECAVHAPEIWDPDTETFTVVASHEATRIYHSTAVLLPDGRVLAAGGENHDGAEESAEVYSPAYLFRGARPVIADAPRQVFYGDSFIVGTPDASDIASIALIRPSAVTHNFDQNQRFMNLNFSVGVDALNITAPPSGNIAPPGDYMLFIVNSNGVPSVATFIRVVADAMQVNIPPQVSIGSPSNNQAFVEGDSVDFSGSANDEEEGDLTSSLTWASSIDGAIGSGGAFSSASLSVGTHQITASVTDMGGSGATGSAMIVINILPPGGTTASLAVTDDAFTRAPNPDNNYGSRDFMRVRSNGDKVSFADFDTAGLTGIVSSATLNLYVQDVLISGTLNINQVLGDWDEQSITHNSRPPFDPIPTAVVSIGPGDTDSFCR